mgnify:CR=1 FL=1
MRVAVGTLRTPGGETSGTRDRRRDRPTRTRRVDRRGRSAARPSGDRQRLDVGRQTRAAATAESLPVDVRHEVGDRFVGREAERAERDLRIDRECRARLCLPELEVAARDGPRVVAPEEALQHRVHRPHERAETVTLDRVARGERPAASAVAATIGGAPKNREGRPARQPPFAEERKLAGVSRPGARGSPKCRSGHGARSGRSGGARGRSCGTPPESPSTSTSTFWGWPCTWIPSSKREVGEHADVGPEETLDDEALRAEAALADEIDQHRRVRAAGRDQREDRPPARAPGRVNRRGKRRRIHPVPRSVSTRPAGSANQSNPSRRRSARGWCRGGARRRCPSRDSTSLSARRTPLTLAPSESLRRTGARRSRQASTVR